MDGVFEAAEEAFSNHRKEIELLETKIKDLRAVNNDLREQWEKHIHPVGPQGIIIYEFDRAKPYNYPEWLEQLKLFLSDKGATVIVLDLHKGVDKIVEGMK
ncbi:MAG: hypothetical protein KAQ99_01565 [Candidatus Aureabacteria bacterium]|nr:hypothetical protein [Candidatus Auribacterota bacterium]